VIRRHPWLWLVLLAVMVLGGFYFQHRAAAGDRELPVYVAGGERMAAGEEIYRGGQDRKPFTYPPFAALPFVPFGWLPASWQAPLWFEVNLVVLLGILALLQRFAARPAANGPPRLLWFWLLTVALGGHHVVSVFTNQSHDLLVAGALALLAVAWGRAGWIGGLLAGCWAGAGGAFKATPLLFLGLFGLRPHVAAVLATAAVFGALSLLPDSLCPRQDGGSWFLAWIDLLRGLQVGGTADVQGVWGAHSVLNQSLSGTLTRLLSVPAVGGTFVVENVALVDLGAGARRAVTIAVQLAVLALLGLAALLGRRAAAPGADAAARQTVAWGEVAAFACGMLLLSPQSSKAHFCSWLFPAAFLADRALRGPRDRWLWPLLGAVFASGALLSKGILGRDLGNRVLAYGNVTWCTVLFLLATLRALWTAARRP
jgi:alpha-1,2-mannosyltransferase